MATACSIKSTQNVPSAVKHFDKNSCPLSPITNDMVYELSSITVVNSPTDIHKAKPNRVNVPIIRCACDVNEVKKFQVTYYFIE